MLIDNGICSQIEAVDVAAPGIESYEHLTDDDPRVPYRGQWVGKGNALGRARTQHPSPWVQKTNFLSEARKAREACRLSHESKRIQRSIGVATGAVILFVCFDVSNLSTIRALALCALGLLAGSGGIVRRHGGISWRLWNDAFGFFTSEPTVLVLFETRKLFLEPRRAYVSQAALGRGRRARSCRLRLRASWSGSPVGIASANLHYPLAL